ncbi:MAG: TAXI family TRAP transporter solute-binding subunit [Selenomonadaceae bacterium]|nr:TAXI family TRAP transporter solute-binding subunit [Selenomonadaceae bacterium]
MFSIRSVFIFLIASMIMAAGCGSKDLTLATGNQVSSFHRFGVAIAEILSQSGIPVVAQTTEGSVNNVQLLRDKQVDLALVQNDIAFYAENGIEMFEGDPVTNLRGIATLYPLSCHFVTLASSEINDIESLRGKKVSVGGIGRADITNSRQILDIYGISFDDIEVFNLSQQESLESLKNGEIDAAFITTVAPAGFITEFANQTPIKMLPLSDEQIGNLTTKYPYYTKTVLPSQIYPGIQNEIPTVSVKAMLVATNRLYDDDAYKITETLFTNTDRFISVHPIGKTIKRDSARSGMSIQMHEGANRFFNE